jgi:hypothetical protein
MSQVDISWARRVAAPRGLGYGAAIPTRTDPLPPTETPTPTPTVLVNANDAPTLSPAPYATATLASSPPQGAQTITFNGLANPNSVPKGRIPRA